MYPILFRIGSFPIRAYGVAVVLAFLAGVYVAVWIARHRRRPYAELLWDMMPWLLLWGIVGARTWEVVFGWSNFAQAPWTALAIWHGGLSIQGGLVGGAIAAAVWCRRHGVSAVDLADTLAPAAALGQGVGRLTACVLNGDAFGRPTGTEWGIVYPPGSQAYAVFGSQPLWPAEIFEGILNLALFALLVRVLLRGRQPAGAVSLWYALGYSLIRFSLEFLRGDSLMVGGLKAAQVSSLVIGSAAALALVWLFWRRSGTAPGAPEPVSPGHGIGENMESQR